MNENLLNLDFEIFNRDRLVGHVVIENGVLIKNENYTTDIWSNYFRNVKDAITMRKFLSDRIFPPERFDETMQRITGLKEYDVLELLKVTHGVDVDDFMWIRFKGENLVWEDVKVRD